MTAEDLRTFTAHLIGLQELLGGSSFSETRLRLYCEAVGDLPLKALLGAIQAAARMATFFPKPAELRALAQGDTADGVENAWLLFQKAMRDHGAYASLATADPTLGATIEAVFGSWPQACTAELSPEMWTAKRKEFERAYRLFAKRGLIGARYLPGLIEQQNGGRAEWRKHSTLAVIGANGIERLRGECAEQYLAQLTASPPEGCSAGFVDIRSLVGTSIGVLARLEAAAVVQPVNQEKRHEAGKDLGGPVSSK